MDEADIYGWIADLFEGDDRALSIRILIRQLYFDFHFAIGFLQSFVLKYKIKANQCLFYAIRAIPRLRRL